MYCIKISEHLKSDLIRGVTTLEGDNLVVALLSVHLKSGLIKEVAFGEMWSYKRGPPINCILTLGDKLHNQQQHPVLCYCCTSQLDMDLHMVILSSKGTNVPWGMVLGQMFQLDNSDQQDN